MDVATETTVEDVRPVVSVPQPRPGAVAKVSGPGPPCGPWPTPGSSGTAKDLEGVQGKHRSRHEWILECGSGGCGGVPELGGVGLVGCGR